ncbi:MAG: roadblock/LC7 domain-containing protein [Promethearchaeota archaeon]
MNKKAFDEIDRILKEIFDAKPGLKKLILANRTGLTIAHASKSMEYLADIDELGVISSLVYGTCENFGESLDIGPLNMITLDFADAKVRIVPCGEGILCFYSDNEYTMVKPVTGMFKKELQNLINAYIKNPKVQAIKLDEFLSETFFK